MLRESLLWGDVMPNAIALRRTVRNVPILHSEGARSAVGQARPHLHVKTM